MLHYEGEGSSPALMSPKCSCSAEPLGRYILPTSIATEKVEELVPYEDGCLTPTQPSSLVLTTRELVLVLQKTRQGAEPVNRILLMETIGSTQLAADIVGGSEHPPRLAHFNECSSTATTR